MKYPRRWECLSENTFRLRRPGGYYLKEVHTIISGDKSVSTSVAVVFVRDSPHDDEWELDEK